MTKLEAKQRIEKLKKVINHHRYLYHVLDRQEISPEALDSLKHELFLLEQDYPEFITSDSPTQRVAGKPLEGFKKVGHEVPMLSIEDIFSEKEIYDWQDYLKKLAPSEVERFEYFCEQKIDGFAVSLLYKNGIFSAGSTRGTGKVGEDVTQNLKTIESIPLKLSFNKLVETKFQRRSFIEVRGEVYMEKNDFAQLNEELEKRGEKTYANPRNLAAGSIRQLDSKLAASRPLKFMAYSLVTDLGQKNHSEEHQILRELGFRSDIGKECQDISDIIDYWRKIAKKRETLPFQIDGVVISVNDDVLFQKLGVVGKSPRGIRAFKFSPKQATTKVKDIKVQVGRTGILTPVAVLEPVEVGGVTVSRATLHNEDEIKRLGLKIGDTVIVGRAGDVIPDIIKVLPGLRTGKERDFAMPSNCPVCGSKVVRPEGEVRHICTNPKCFAIQREGFYHFVSRPAFNILGLGPKTIDKLIDAGLISSPADLFKLQIGDILPLESLPRRKPKAFLRGFAERSAENIIGAIQKNKEIPLANFIYALGILHVGEETALNLSQYFGTIQGLRNSAKEHLREVPDVGIKVSESIYFWFQSKKNQKLVDDLLNSGVKILPPPKIGKRLAGKTFVLTGTLESLTREEAHKKIRMFGGKTSALVSKETDFLVAGKEPGSKLDKAKQLGVKIIEEKKFIDLLK